jgi:hypothetical protein
MGDMTVATHPFEVATANQLKLLNAEWRRWQPWQLFSPSRGRSHDFPGIQITHSRTLDRLKSCNSCPSCHQRGPLAPAAGKAIQHDCIRHLHCIRHLPARIRARV